MKIGLDLRFYRRETGGLGRYSRNLLKELLVVDKDNRYTAVITKEDEDEFDRRAPNLNKLVLPMAPYSLSEQTKLPGILKQQNFDLVHFANFNHPLLYRGKFVVTVHDLIMQKFPSGRQSRSPLRRTAYRLVMNDCKRAQLVIVPSLSTRADLVELFRFNPAKIAVTPEGSEEMFRPHTDREKIAVKERLGLPKKYLLFVSRWEPYKGLTVLLDAYKSLKGSRPDLGLVICGRASPHCPAITQAVLAAQASDPNIVTPGFIGDEDLAAVYAAAAVYVHPSAYEGFGIMVLEAFASGVPVVTSNTSSLPEVVGDAGLLVDPNNTAELAEAIDKVLADGSLATELVAKGLERVKQYSWRRMAEATLAIYRRSLNG